ncbi:MAG: hypothetical protein U0894_10185 [Pirellulales bacterium]
MILGGRCRDAWDGGHYWLCGLLARRILGVSWGKRDRVLSPLLAMLRHFVLCQNIPLMATYTGYS